MILSENKEFYSHNHLLNSLNYLTANEFMRNDEYLQLNSEVLVFSCKKLFSVQKLKLF